MDQGAQPSQIGANTNNYTLEELKESQGKVYAKYEFEKFQATTDAQKEYLKKVASPKNEKTYPTLDVIYKKAGSLLQEIETVTYEPYPISFEEAKALFWNIYTELLNKYQREPILSESIKKELPDMIKYFIGDATGKHNQKKGLWVCGGIGTGKTTILEAFSIFTQALNFKHFKVVNCKSIVLQVRKSKDYGVLDNYINKSLCYDDIAAEDRTNIFGNTDEVIQTLLEDFYATRFRKGYVIHATSNVIIDDLKGRYSDERLLDRITEMFNIVTIIGESFRK